MLVVSVDFSTSLDRSTDREQWRPPAGIGVQTEFQTTIEMVVDTTLVVE